ncbi:MAG: galactokinase [Roseivirga sp.]|nr:galactokinase [Roseivirga sp.]
MMLKQVLRAFKEQYAMAPELRVKAPGRINIIGDHTDYNMGFVLPAAIDKYTYFACSRNHSDHISITSGNYNETLKLAPDIKEIASGGWQKYIEAITLILREKGYQFQGYNMLMGSDIPIGSGVSSSAALTCGVIFCINELFDLNISKTDIALMAQQAEIRIGLNCGLMDQYAVIQGKIDHCLFLDCQSLEFDMLPADFQECSIVLINSNISHDLAESEYNHRRQDVEKGISILQQKHPEIASPRDVSLNMLENAREILDEPGQRRISFVLEENERVLKTCEALKASNLALVGQLMNESHRGLSTKYEVSCPELDFLAGFAQSKTYVLGSRMMGGGFGGCTINLVKEGFEEQLIRESSVAYQSSLEKTATAFTVGLGEGIVQI